MFRIGLLSVALCACNADTFGGGDAATTDAGSNDAADGAFDASCALGAPSQCAGNNCSIDQTCCVTSSQVQCRSLGNGCTGESLACLGSNDCQKLDGATPLCCLTNAVITPGCPVTITNGGSVCVATGLCGGAGGARICESDADCPKQTCVRATFANNGSFVLGICQ